jgi:hypothetical protein
MSTLLVVMTWPVAAAVGASRVYLGYHSLAQVLVGSAGLYKLNAVDPQLESAWFQQPLRTYEVKTRFQAFAFKCNLYRYAVYSCTIAVFQGVEKPSVGAPVHVDSP